MNKIDVKDNKVSGFGMVANTDNGQTFLGMWQVQ